MIVGRDERGIVEVLREDFDILASTWDAAWRGLMNEIFDGAKLIDRITTGALFLVWYDALQDADKSFIQGQHPREIIPVFLIETASLQTGGRYDLVPSTWRELYNDGKGRTPKESDDTIIAVDATALPSRRGGNIASAAMASFLECVAESTNYKWFWTYTPDISGVRRWHEKLGAKTTGHLIAKAREGYQYPDVMMMDYSQVLAEKRARKIVA